MGSTRSVARPHHPPLNGLIIVADKAMPARKPRVKIKVRQAFALFLFHAQSRAAVLLAVRRRPSFLAQTIALGIGVSPMGNGRANPTVCNAEIAQWCKRAKLWFRPGATSACLVKRSANPVCSNAGGVEPCAWGYRPPSLQSCSGAAIRASVRHSGRSRWTGRTPRGGS